jgi:hypothetical protein
VPAGQIAEATAHAQPQAQDASGSDDPPLYVGLFVIFALASGVVIPPSQLGENRAHGDHRVENAG